MDAAPPTKRRVRQRGCDLISERLPPGWKLVDRGGDGVVLIAPDGRRSQLVVESVQRLVGREASDIIHRRSTGAVVMARYLSAPVRQRLSEAGVSYVDATGNMRVAVDDPAVYLFDRGAERDPWRGPGRPRSALTGEPAARVVRTLVDTDQEWTMRQLVAAAQTSTGSAYRVVDFLDQDGLIRRNQGRVIVDEWEPLLRRWAHDYDTWSMNRLTRWIAPRGRDRLLATILEQESGGYALTGSIAAQAWVETAPVRLVAAYVTDAIAFGERWGLQPTEAEPNVVLIEPTYESVFDRSTTLAGGWMAVAPSQVAVDLINGPGRSPQEAEALIGWMRAHESAWRH